MHEVLFSSGDEGMGRRGDESRVMEEPELVAVLPGIAQHVLHAVGIVDAADIELRVCRVRSESFQNTRIAEQKCHHPDAPSAPQRANQRLLNTLPRGWREEGREPRAVHLDTARRGLLAGRRVPVIRP